MVLVYILILLAVVLAALFGFAATRPDAFRYDRKTLINAPAAAIFPHINEYHAWKAWSPYEKVDPDMKRTYGNITSGKGAVYSWTGNNKVGEGRMETLEATPSSKVLIRLDFFRPFKAQNTAEFTLAEKAGQGGGGGPTEVTWAMFGSRPFIIKFMGIFMNMDKLMGRDFETGLANLKSLVENPKA